jgi:hypothetical protein
VAKFEGLKIGKFRSSLFAMAEFVKCDAANEDILRSVA